MRTHQVSFDVGIQVEIVSLDVCLSITFICQKGCKLRKEKISKYMLFFWGKMTKTFIKWNMQFLFQKKHV